MIGVDWGELRDYERPGLVHGRYLQISGIVAKNFGFDGPVPRAVEDLVATADDAMSKEFGSFFDITNLESPKTPDPENEDIKYVSYLDLEKDGQRYGGLTMRCMRIKARPQSRLGIVDFGLILPLEVQLDVSLGKFQEQTCRVVRSVWKYIGELHSSTLGEHVFIHEVLGGEILDSGHRVLGKLGLDLSEKPVYMLV
jgi:hypothetical protein